VDASAHASELAHHFYRAASFGDVERAVSYCVRAAKQALELLAFEQAVSHYRRALEALQCRLPIDEQQRFELKLALGSALFRAGEDGNPAMLGAADIARRLGRPELLGRVALAMAGWPRLFKHGRTGNRELHPLLTEALAGKLDDHPSLHARLLGLLALNAPHGTPLETRAIDNQQALALARKLGDDEALYDALLSRLWLLNAPEEMTQRHAVAGELLEVATRLGHRERIFTAHELRVQPLLMLGDLSAADQEIAACAALAEELRLPNLTLQVLRFKLERALGDGRLSEIRGLTEQAVRVRGKAQTSPGYMVTLYAWRTFERALRTDHDWFDRHIGGMTGAVEKSTLYRSNVAHLYALFGRQEEARACYKPLLDRRVLDEARDDDWLMTVALTAEAAAVCGDRSAARELYPRLLPHAACNVVHLDWLMYFGSCAHFLGLLAALLGERAAAIEHFEAALEMNARLGARPFVARTALAYARLLYDAGCADDPRATSPDARSASALAREAAAIAEEIGMQGLAREARALVR
jgi:tetratricopeptide (TPR) repeat protein